MEIFEFRIPNQINTTKHYHMNISDALVQAPMVYYI